MIVKISLFFWMASIVGTIFLHPKLELPLMHYHLLMILHSVLLGVVLLPLLQKVSRETPFQKISWTLIISGLSILLIGFLTAPRTAMVKDGGIFITAGVILSLAHHLKNPFSVLFWPSIALIETCLLGYKLGKSLDRIAVDPIPFSTLSTHATTGLFLALPAMIFISRIKESPDNSSKIYSSAFFASGVLTSFYLYSLPAPTKGCIFLIFLLSAWGIFFLATKNNKFITILILLSIVSTIYLNTDIHFEGSTIGFLFFGWSLFLAILVLKPVSTPQLVWITVGSFVLLEGLLYQNYLITIIDGLILTGLILREFIKITAEKEECRIFKK
jgi:hypothetical protein